MNDREEEHAPRSRLIRYNERRLEEEQLKRCAENNQTALICARRFLNKMDRMIERRSVGARENRIHVQEIVQFIKYFKAAHPRVTLPTHTLLTAESCVDDLRAIVNFTEQNPSGDSNFTENPRTGRRRPAPDSSAQSFAEDEDSDDEDNSSNPRMSANNPYIVDSQQI